MKALKFYVLLVALYSIPFFIHAERTPQEEKQVVGYADFNGALHNTRNIYGSTINYYIPDNERQLQLNVNDGSGQTVDVTIDYEEYVKEALSEWAPSGVAFNRVYGIDLPEHTVLVGIVNYNDDTLGETIFRPTSNTRLNIGRGAFNRVGMLNYEKLKQHKAIPADMSPEDYLRLKVRVTLKHEIGHVLGLLHNNEAGMDFSLGTGVRIATCRLLNQPPSIMLNGNNYDYIDRLAAYLERPVTESDIGPSRNDISGARIMFTQTSVQSMLARFSCLGAASAISNNEHDF